MSEKIPAPGTDEYNAFMIAKADAGMAEIRVTENGPDGKPVTVVASREDAPVTKPAAPAAAGDKPQRPEWCPEKFWNAETGAVNSEALAKSYGELEKGRGKAPLADPVKPVAPAAPVKSAEQTAFEVEVAAAKAEAANATDDAGKAAAKTKVDAAQAKLDAANAAATRATETSAQADLESVIAKAQEEFSEKGVISDESYAALAAKGLSRDVVDAYAEGQKARGEAISNKVYGEVGGQDAYKLIQEWAVANLSSEEIAAANAAFGSDDINVVIGQVRSLKGRYDAAVGTSGKRIEGQSGTPSAGEPFKSKEEVTKAMSDPKYGKDAAYRKSVENRIAASMKANIDLGF